MAGKTKKKLPEPPAEQSFWSQLTWDDIYQWVGSRTADRGKSYQRNGRVRSLALTPNGSLHATVLGTLQYATQVEAQTESGHRLLGTCSCPVGLNCKHAVATALEYLAAIKEQRDIPILQSEPISVSEPGEPEEEEVDVRAYLDKLRKKELVDYILNLATHDRGIKEDLQRRATFKEGKTDNIALRLRNEIESVTAEEAWYHHWSGEGHLPDYSNIRQQLQFLYDKGCYEELLELGELLFDRGNVQVSHSDDEGKTARAISQCLDIVFEAVVESTRPDFEKLLYITRMSLQDEYELCQRGDEILNRAWPAQAWSEVADALRAKLDALAPPENWSAEYKREWLCRWVIVALREAGREEEVLPLMEAEVELTNSYPQLVAELIHQKRYEEAESWADKGCEKTKDSYPGIARQLKEQLLKMAELKGDWITVAARHANEFFSSPSLTSWFELLEAADKAGCRKAVQAGALEFLKTGQVPKPYKGKRKKPKGNIWPLPTQDEEELKSGYRFWEEGPHYTVLLDLALREKDTKAILQWQKKLKEESPRIGHYKLVEVADAIAGDEPKIAVSYYQTLIDDRIAEVSPAAYNEAAPYLKRVRDLLPEAEWESYRESLRAEHARKRRFLEVLNRIEGRRIMEDM